MKRAYIHTSDWFWKRKPRGNEGEPIGKGIMKGSSRISHLDNMTKDQGQREDLESNEKEGADPFRALDVCGQCSRTASRNQNTMGGYSQSARKTFHSQNRTVHLVKLSFKNDEKNSDVYK